MMFDRVIFERSQRKKRKKREFSKVVLALVMATYFFGVAFVSAIILLAVRRGMADIGTLVTALLTFTARLPPQRSAGTTGKRRTKTCRSLRSQFMMMREERRRDESV
ncbi:hypothetical protein G3578_07320 [Brevibacillus sp. SYP-B805]|uniref:hypothetical protein n=1 Tax=Brevibacillus sp. SYP-B805 TaxID=1578199 RepID=UPI0013EE0829|nr:hypothetical protein [Brevibacillus sp. SYP-B805]NGQ94994.1 hypothetical protein [Brevibacillus sp. SYP-B805]